MASSFVTDTALPISVAVLMVGVGSTLTARDFWEEARAPRGLVVGSVGQIALLPALAIAVTRILGLDADTAAGLVLLASCPGGVFSNLMAHLARGRAALSIVLTATSTAIAGLSLPFWLSVSSIAWEGDVLSMTPKMVAMTTIPVVVGVLFRAYLPKWATRLEKPFNVVSGVFLAFVMVLLIVGKGRELLPILTTAGPPVVLLSALGFAGGAALARLAGLDRAATITISLEVGIQNAALAAALALQTFGTDRGATVAAPAMLYLLFTFFPAVFLIAIGRRGPTAAPAPT